ncbi:YbhB/YbcL family Raf kinase inhibitor-like protein [Pandoraea sp. XY-2]|nr:YbhB/YbcL family Raf kinase inhibitor-like protein [Pandoraea sp. XY-2]
MRIAGAAAVAVTLATGAGVACAEGMSVSSSAFADGGMLPAIHAGLGKNVSGAMAYRGACPPVGDSPHHYIITVTATDLEPGRLPPGLDANGLTTALAGHTLNGSTLVARYGR